MINRRSLITGLISFAAAPAIVRASNLMVIKPVKLYNPRLSGTYLRMMQQQYEYYERNQIDIANSLINQHIQRIGRMIIETIPKVYGEIPNEHS